MKKYEVRFRPFAEADPFDLYRYIAAGSGHTIAGEYIERIEAACMALGTFPERGTRRDATIPHPVCGQSASRAARQSTFGSAGRMSSSSGSSTAARTSNVT
jgi:plasmid stabilization system protein ParE